jgi:predicted RNA-binding Zn-ribbon protein involved in translation (DUF1610 family)
MAKLKCPGCGARGDIRSQESFEVRGRDPRSDYSRRVRKCRSCGRGVVVRPRAFPREVRAELIPDELWTAMEQRWRDGFESGVRAALLQHHLASSKIERPPSDDEPT